MLEARVLLQHVDVRPEFRFECAAAVGEDSDYRPGAPSILEGRAHAQFGKSRSLLLPNCHLVAALRRPSPRHQREPAAHLVCDRRHAAERSRLELIRRPLHRRVEWHHHLGRKKHRARRVRRDLRPAAQDVRLLARDVAFALGHGAAAENDPVSRLSHQLQALPQAADEAQQDDDHHHDQCDTQRGHQRSRAPDHQASKVVGYRNCSHSNRVKIRRQNQHPPVVAVLGRFSHLGATLQVRAGSLQTHLYEMLSFSLYQRIILLPPLRARCARAWCRLDRDHHPGATVCGPPIPRAHPNRCVSCGRLRGTPASTLTAHAARAAGRRARSEKSDARCDS